MEGKEKEKREAFSLHLWITLLNNVGWLSIVCHAGVVDKPRAAQP